MPNHPPTTPANDPTLLAILKAAALPTTGSFLPKAGWVSRVWVGENHVVRLSTDRFPDAYHHEAAVVALLADTDVPHPRQIAQGTAPQGPWSVTERIPGRTLHETWPTADTPTRQSIIKSLAAALRALHRIPAPPNLRPPWLINALAGHPWPAFHPPVVSATLQNLEAAQQHEDHDPQLLKDVAIWIQDRLPLFATDEQVLVHGDLHGSNIMVDQGQVTGLIDFAEAVAQPADVELDTLLRWCANARDYPPTPDRQGLDESTLTEVPTWLHNAYPELFDRDNLRERLNFYDLYVELAIHAHHPQPDIRQTAQHRIANLLSGHNHLDRLHW
ncbi:phosphotransferase [Kribbella sp. NPDC051770]|uniref:phosphotransferase family protein n=1 Tax=Kribbella sp. NPDC051770 TaxID=3155413 RepID=UPI00343199EE